MQAGPRLKSKPARARNPLRAGTSRGPCDGGSAALLLQRRKYTHSRQRFRTASRPAARTRPNGLHEPPSTITEELLVQHLDPRVANLGVIATPAQFLETDVPFAG